MFAAPPSPLPLCAACGSPGADRARRSLCPRCYADGPIRSSFDSSGRRIADPPAPHVEVSEYVVPALTVETGAADGPSPLPQSQRGRPRGQGQRPDPAADDAALLNAIDTLTAAGQFRTMGTDLPAAGRSAAGRLASLSDARSEAAARRLIADGRVLAVAVCRVGQRGGNRMAAGLRRVGG